MTKLAHEMAKPRVLLSGHLPPPMGGMAAFYQALLNSSLPKRVDLSFVQTSSQGRTVAESGRPTASNMLSALQDCARFARAVLRHRPQIAHIGTAYGLSFLKHSVCVMIARLFGSRVLLHPHCAFAVLYTDRSAKWRWYFRTVVRFCDGIVGLSHEWGQLRSVLPSCQVYAMPNAVDLAPYRAIAQGHMARSENEPPPTVLYLGALGKAKGSYDLVEAARLLALAGERVSFDLVGDEMAPGEREKLQERISEADLGARVRLHPSVSGSQKMGFFRKADLLAYPSYHEGMPMAVLEPMAAALPVVATRVGGLPDLVMEGVNGLLVEPGRPEQLAAAIRRLSVNAELRTAMGIHSYNLACERFDIEQRVKQLVDIYEQALVPNRPGHADCAA